MKTASIRAVLYSPGRAQVLGRRRAVGTEWMCWPMLLVGLFGMPTCLVGNEKFFGQDRLSIIREALSC